MAEVMGAFQREQPMYFRRNTLGLAALILGALCLLFLSIFYKTRALWWFFYLGWQVITCLLMVLIMKTLKSSNWPAVLKKLANLAALLMFTATVYQIVISLIFNLIAKRKTGAERYGMWNFIGFAAYATGQMFMMMVITVMGLRHMSAKKTDDGGMDEETGLNADHSEKLHHPDSSQSSEDEAAEPGKPIYNDDN